MIFKVLLKDPSNYNQCFFLYDHLLHYICALSQELTVRKMEIPSDLIHQRSERLLPAVHLYHPDARDDFIHGVYPVIRQSRRFSPETAG